MIHINGQKRTTLSTESAFWWTNHDFGTTLSTESALWWTNYGSSHPTQKKPGLFSGVREIASFYGQALSEGFLRSAQPLRSEGHGICRMVRRWPSTTLFTEWDFWWTNHDSNTTLSTKSALWWTNRSLRTTLSTESAFWWTNRSFSNASEMRQSSNPNRQTMIQIGTRCSRRDDLWSHRLQLKLTYC